MTKNNGKEETKYAHQGKAVSHVGGQATLEKNPMEDDGVGIGSSITISGDFIDQELVK